jgi:predicted nucleic acid-binding protein
MLADRVLSGDEILVSALTHYEILWGYRKIGLSTARYEAFLSSLEIEVAPLVQEDAVVAANKKPSREKLVDALIAATVSRYDASVWTWGIDFLHFLPKEKVIIL